MSSRSPRSRSPRALSPRARSPRRKSPCPPKTKNVPKQIGLWHAVLMKEYNKRKRADSSVSLRSVMQDPKVKQAYNACKRR